MSSDVHLVVCRGECTHNFLDLFGGFNVMMQKFYFVFAAALLHKVDLVMLSMQKMKFTGKKRFPFLSIQHLDS